MAKHAGTMDAGDEVIALAEAMNRAKKVHSGDNFRCGFCLTIYGKVGKHADLERNWQANRTAAGEWIERQPY